MAALVGMSNSDSAISSTLKAVYDPSARVGNLEVVLTIKTESGTQRQFKKVYTSDGEIKIKIFSSGLICFSSMGCLFYV